MPDLLQDINNLADAKRLFDKFNQAINGVILDGRFEDRGLYIDIEDDIEAEIASNLDINPEEFKAELGRVVAIIIINSGLKEPYGYFKELVRVWERQKRNYSPPCTALLTVFSLAAENMRADNQMSSTNYYERLFEVLNIENEDNKKAVKRSAKETVHFWESFNIWLSENQFIYGKPTAKPLSAHEAYIGYPISQALIRETEREEFTKIFLRHGLRPSINISFADAEHFIKLWTISSQSNQHLRRLAASSSQMIRERLASSFCETLRNWEDLANYDNAQSGTKPLSSVSLTLNKKTKPFQKIYCRFFVKEKRDLEGHNVTLALKANTLSETLEKADIDGLHFEYSPNDDDVYFLGPNQLINLSQFLTITFSINVPTLKQEYRFFASPIYLFSKGEGSQYNLSSGIQLLTQHTLLCHEKWVARVLNVLSHNSCNCEYDLKRAGDIDGLPDDWVLFDNFVMIEPPDYLLHENGLDLFFPKGDVNKLEVISGFNLTSDFWHKSQELMFSAIPVDTKAKLEIWQPNQEKPTQEIEIQKAELLVKRFSIKNVSDFKLKLVPANSNRSSEINIFSRDADSPLPIRPDSAILGSNKAADLSHFTLQNEEIERQEFNANTNQVAYGIVSCIRQEANELISYEQFSNGGEISNVRIEGELVEEDIMNHEYSKQKINLQFESCVIRGDHYYWVISQEPIYVDGRKRIYQCTCKHCGFQYVGSNVPTRNNALPAKTQLITSRKRQFSFEKKETFDNKFDALCFLGSGSHQKFEKIFDDPEKTDLETYKARRALSDLAHVEFKLNDNNNFYPQKWQVLPSTLFTAENDMVCWSGFRSNKTLEKLKDKFGSIGSMLDEEHRDSQLFTAYRWKCSEIGRVKELIQGIELPNGRSFEFLEKPYFEMLKALPKLGDVYRLLPKLSSVKDKRSLHKFEPRQARFFPHVGHIKPGAYKSVAFGMTVYFFMDADEIMYRGPVEIIKVLGARLEGVNYFGYDVSKRELSFPLGCDLPGIIRRILVAHSGLMPYKEGNRMIYTDIPSKSAGTILERLS